MGWMTYCMMSVALLFLGWAIRAFLPKPRWQQVVMGVVVNAAFFAVAWGCLGYVSRDGAPPGTDQVGMPLVWRERELSFGGCISTVDGTLAFVDYLEGVYVDGPVSKDGRMLSLDLALWSLPIPAFWFILLRRRKPKAQFPVKRMPVPDGPTGHH